MGYKDTRELPSGNLAEYGGIGRRLLSSSLAEHEALGGSPIEISASCKVNLAVETVKIP